MSEKMKEIKQQKKSLESEIKDLGRLSGLKGFGGGGKNNW